MKKITFLVAGLLLSGSLALASETTIFSGNPTNYAIDYREAEPVMFTERGIVFLVFPNGEMDFNAEPSSNNGSTYYRRSDRNQSNATYGAPSTYSAGRGVRIERDTYGRVRRVGNVFISYDRKNRVSRIGTVYMVYNNFALTQIGNMRLTYNRSGHLTDVNGYINANNRDYVYEPYYDYDNDSCNSTRSNDNKVYYRKPAGGTRSTRG